MGANLFYLGPRLKMGGTFPSGINNLKQFDASSSITSSLVG